MVPSVVVVKVAEKLFHEVSGRDDYENAAPVFTFEQIPGNNHHRKRLARTGACQQGNTPSVERTGRKPDLVVIRNERLAGLRIVYVQCARIGTNDLLRHRPMRRPEHVVDFLGEANLHADTELGAQQLGYTRDKTDREHARLAVEKFDHALVLVHPERLCHEALTLVIELHRGIDVVVHPVQVLNGTAVIIDAAVERVCGNKHDCHPGRQAHSRTPIPEQSSRINFSTVSSLRASNADLRTR